MKKHWLNNDYSKCVVYTDENKIVSVKALEFTNKTVNILAGSKDNPLTVKEKIITFSPDNTIKKLQKKLNTYIGKSFDSFKKDVAPMGWTAWDVVPLS